MLLHLVGSPHMTGYQFRATELSSDVSGSSEVRKGSTAPPPAGAIHSVRCGRGNWPAAQSAGFREYVGGLTETCTPISTAACRGGRRNNHYRRNHRNCPGVTPSR
jgi:hypothetical protein